MDISISGVDEPAIKMFEEALKGAEGIAVVVEEEDTAFPLEGRDLIEQLAYSIEDPITDSEYRGSEVRSFDILFTYFPG